MRSEKIWRIKLWYKTVATAQFHDTKMKKEQNDEDVERSSLRQYRKGQVHAYPDLKTVSHFYSRLFPVPVRYTP